MKIQHIDQQALKQAKADHKLYLEKYPHKRVICDDTITPFAGAMKSLGYEAILSSSGCSILSTCQNDSCRKVNSTLYRHRENNETVNACPHCQEIRTIE